jgi:hypothetical protein
MEFNCKEHGNLERTSRHVAMWSRYGYGRYTTLPAARDTTVEPLLSDSAQRIPSAGAQIAKNSAKVSQKF